MKFEEAIAEMRKGKRCRIEGDERWEFFMHSDKLFCRLGDSPEHLDHVQVQWCLEQEWHVIEPPPALPRLFRAKWNGAEVTGAEWSSGWQSWESLGSIYAGERCNRQLTDIKYEDEAERR